VSKAITQDKIDAIRARMKKLTHDSERQWGTLSPHEMICHLSDALRHPLGDRPAPLPKPSWFRHTLLKWLFLWVIPQYPKGASTRAYFNPKSDGTKPEEFTRDLETLDQLTLRFVAAAPRISVEHTRFGRMRGKEWLRWWWMHTDHHLRQFGR
jgi:hypothetical protein